MCLKFLIPVKCPTEMTLFITNVSRCTQSPFRIAWQLSNFTAKTSDRCSILGSRECVLLHPTVFHSHSMCISHVCFFFFKCYCQNEWAGTCIKVMLMANQYDRSHIFRNPFVLPIRGDFEKLNYRDQRLFCNWYKTPHPPLRLPANWSTSTILEKDW